MYNLLIYKIFILYALTLLAVSGCSSTGPATPQEQASNQEEYVCLSERRTGSNIGQKVCRRRGDVEERREEDQRALKEVRDTLRHPGTPGEQVSVPD